MSDCVKCIFSKHRFNRRCNSYSNIRAHYFANIILVEETNQIYVIALFSEMEMDDYPFAYDESYPFRSAVTANAMMGRFAGTRFRRESRGVYDECCVKPCSIQELTSYCGRVAQ